ncbi:MAG: thioredoxin family protein [Bacteroidaceae bacterium]|nr:thioredoxin family protein [Bacteroidaceae bacterium]
MTKKLFLLLILIAATLLSYAQFAQPAHFTAKQQITPSGQLEITFSSAIDAGWHVYGSEMEDGGPTPASITLEQQTGVQPAGPLKTIGGSIHRGIDPMFQCEVQTVEGSVTFRQLYNITADHYQLKGYLRYGACNDHTCIPPSTVEFQFQGDAPAKPREATEQTQDKTAPADDSEPADTTAAAIADTTTVAPAVDSEPSLWEPVIDRLQALEQGGTHASSSLFWIFLMGMAGGLLALLTPCVWPIIPMTVSYFIKRKSGVRTAIAYGISIIVIYVGLGMLVTLLFGASALNAMSTNAIFNIFFFLLLLVFGLSFLGGFELTLPSSWSTAVDGKAEKTGGIIGIFLMAFTLSLVSFSCTGPIIGFLLVEVGTTGSLLAPVTGMLGFAIALALPFTLFAMFPSWLKSAPRSGNWMNAVKVTLGFLELAFSLKFLSVADLAYGWHILDREVFLCLWIVIFAAMGAYLLHFIRLPHDEDEYDETGTVIAKPRTGTVRLMAGLSAFAFAIYMIPGLWGAPCKAVSAFAPPVNTQDFNLYSQDVTPRFQDYDKGMAYAQEHGMPVMLDFTGFGCVNCRKMEAAVWTDTRVADIINNKYVLITLHVDDKTPLETPHTVVEMGQTRTLRTVGDRWSYLQRHKFGANAQPFYVLLDAQGQPLAPSYSYNEDIPAYIDWLNSGLH